MANGHGGYREPANPAPVSGPGALSQRTDGQGKMQLPDAKYGEQTAFQDAQGAAPMASGPDLSKLVSMGAPSQRPSEDIMAGMSGGPGAGPSAPPPADLGGVDPQDVERLRASLPVLILLASSPDASPATKQYVRQLRGELG